MPQPLPRDLALDVARRALPEFGLPADASVEFVKQRENVVFRVEHEGRAYALRLHRHGLRTPGEIRTESSYVARLFVEGLPVSELLPTASGGHSTPVRDANGVEHIVDVQRWVGDARQLGDAGDAWLGVDPADPADFATLGDVCGRMHEVSRRLGRIDGFERGAWDVDGLAGASPLWGDPRRLARTADDADAVDGALARIRETLGALGTGDDVFGVIHADFTPENVLMTRDGLTLIDFDDFGEGFWLFDLATILFWYHRHERAAEYRAALLGAYERRFPVSDAARDALDALVLARGLTYLAWAADRPGDETSAFLEAEVLPVVVELCRAAVADRLGEAIAANAGTARAAASPSTAPTTGEPRMTESIESLRARRSATLGPYSPLFYDRPLHFVSGEGAWLTDADGHRYLDAYNNVPQVGHANPRVADATSAQLHTLNVHTRYLSQPVVDYAEALLATFDAPLDRVYFTNSGSESNELAFRIARHVTGRDGVIVTDFSYHGNTISLAEVTTGLTVSTPFGEHARAIHVPDLDTVPAGDELAAAELLEHALAQVDEAIASLKAAGHPVSALLIDSSFSTEGLPRLPEGYLTGLVDRVRAAGGLIIADEVQAGLGRLGDAWWGHQATGFSPDLVTLGKPLGNGFPIGGVVTTEAILDSFSSANMYFNTFAGTPASAAAGHAVLREVQERGLVERAGDLGRHVAKRLGEVAARHEAVRAAKGRGLFFGLELVDAEGRPDAALAKRVVEALVRERILISRIGPGDNVMKIRPPLVIEQDELDIVIDALDRALGAEAGAAGAEEAAGEQPA